MLLAKRVDGLDLRLAEGLGFGLAGCHVSVEAARILAVCLFGRCDPAAWRKLFPRNAHIVGLLCLCRFGIGCVNGVRPHGQEYG